MAALSLALATMSGCGTDSAPGSGPASDTVVVLAASSLTESLTEAAGPGRVSGLRDHPAVGRCPLPGSPARLPAQHVAGHRRRHTAHRPDRPGEPARPFTLVAEVTIAAVADLRLTVGQHLWATVKATEVRAYPA